MADRCFGDLGTSHKACANGCVRGPMRSSTGWHLICVNILAAHFWGAVPVPRLPLPAGTLFPPTAHPGPQELRDWSLSNGLCRLCSGSQGLFPGRSCEQAKFNTAARSWRSQAEALPQRGEGRWPASPWRRREQKPGPGVFREHLGVGRNGPHSPLWGHVDSRPVQEGSSLGPRGTWGVEVEMTPPPRKSQSCFRVPA